ncbi:hypothetical protein CH371_15580 [Leptospira wolffii]|uniref:Uncharacterized protein n=1 Tax=Leptospira wolffii TaxID=409998 RepID=A0A2M9Z915_9LEPT|nr:hypothetical protein [Leptospira wolffii]PJZ64921.1 hypothetical protein CH371_15580 [Leptospira wolffii]
MTSLGKGLSIAYFIFRAIVASLFLTFLILVECFGGEFSVETFAQVVLRFKLLIWSLVLLLTSLFGIIYNIRLVQRKSFVFWGLSLVAYFNCLFFFVEILTFFEFFRYLIWLPIFEGFVLGISIFSVAKTDKSIGFNNVIYKSLIFLVLLLIIFASVFEKILAVIQDFGVVDEINVYEISGEWRFDDGTHMRLGLPFDNCNLPNLKFIQKHAPATLSLNWICLYKIEGVELTRCTESLSPDQIQGRIRVDNEVIPFEIPAESKSIYVDLHHVRVNGLNIHINERKHIDNEVFPTFGVKIMRRRERWRTTDSDIITCLD